MNKKLDPLFQGVPICKEDSLNYKCREHKEKIKVQERKNERNKKNTEVKNLIKEF